MAAPLSTALSVTFSWRNIGTVRLDAGKLRFPDAPEAPGIYRFAMDGAAGATSYIGETDRIRRRFQNYRTPGVSQPTNVRLNKLLLDLLAAGGTASVSIITNAEVETDDGRRVLDLRTKPGRLLVENAALVLAVMNGERVENL